MASNTNGKRPAEEDAQLPAKKVKSDYNNVITVIVDKDKSRFVVHQDLICDRCPFFKAACSRQWVEGQTRTIELPQYASRTFKAYLEWAYSKTSDLSGIFHELYQDDQEYAGCIELHRARKRCYELSKLWILADYMGDTACSNKVIDNLVREVTQFPALPLGFNGLYRMIYAETGGKAGLRKWLIDTVLPYISRRNIEKWLARFPAEMITDLFRAYVDVKDTVGLGSLPKNGEGSEYYE